MACSASDLFQDFPNPLRLCFWQPLVGASCPIARAAFLPQEPLDNFSVLPLQLCGCSCDLPQSQSAAAQPNSACNRHFFSTATLKRSPLSSVSLQSSTRFDHNCRKVRQTQIATITSVIKPIENKRRARISRRSQSVCLRGRSEISDRGF